MSNTERENRSSAKSEHDTVLDLPSVKQEAIYTVVRVGEIWSFADIDALETVCRELLLQVERIDAADPRSPRNLTRPVVIRGRNAKSKAADFAARMRLLAPSAEWSVVELK